MPVDGRKRRIANLSAVAVMILGVGTASALFVDYLADRALARSVAQAAKPAVETADAAAVEAQPQARPAVPSAAPKTAATSETPPTAAPAPLPAEPIEAPLPDASAIARVAAGAPLDSQDDEADSALAEEDPAATGAIAYADEPKAKKKQAPAAEQPEADASANGSAGGSARVRQSVNLRSSPQKGSSVLGVVPANSTVGVISCDGWCKISFNGKTGWVYRSFLSGVN